MHESQFNDTENFFPEPHYNLIQLPKLNADDVSATHFLKIANWHYSNYLQHPHPHELDLAICHYQEATQLDPGLVEAEVKLTAALLNKNEISVTAAIARGDKSIKSNPDYIEAYLYQGNFFILNDQFDAAIEIISKALARCREVQKTSPALFFTLSKAFNKKRESLEQPVFSSQSAMLSLQALQSFVLGLVTALKTPACVEIFFSAACNDFKVLGLSAVGRCLKWSGQSQIIQAFYTWAAQQCPEESIFLHHQGDLAIANDDTSLALAQYEKASALDPVNAMLQVKLSHCYLDLGNTSAAIQRLELAVTQGDITFNTRFALAKLLSQETDYIRALYYFKTLLDEKPENPYVYSHIGFILFKLEDIDGAIAQYKNALLHGKDNHWLATIARTLGSLYFHVKNDVQNAIKFYEIALEFSPDDTDCLSLLGDLYMEQNRFEKALAIYRKILTLQPDNADCHNLLGFLLWQLDHNMEAVEAYLEAIALKPENPVAYNNIGVIYLDEHCLPEKAQDMFKVALEQKSDYTLACFNLGRSLEAIGQTANAAKLYSKAKVLNVNNDELDAEHIEERLQNLFLV
ncbi:MAG: tetratricopeptide repeat protein [Cyanobacteria bacterium P01_H01_bin.74]